MAIAVRTTLDFGGTVRITNLPDGVGAQEAATVAQLTAAIEGLRNKDPVVVATTTNVNLVAPGATLDGITMTPGDRFLARGQTTGSQNGIYVFSGAGTPATRSLDCNSAAEINNSLVPVSSGTDAGKTFRQTASVVTLGADAVAYIAFGTGAPAASTSTAGIVQLATQGIVDTGTDALQAVTPATLAGSVYAARKFAQTFGDGTATSYTITHNLSTRDCTVEVYETGGQFRQVIVEIRRTTINSIDVVTDTAPANNSLRALVRA